MKETYYKLNREKLEEGNASRRYYFEVRIEALVDEGILEEVQEEEEMTVRKTAEYDMPRAKERIVKQLTFNPKTGEYETEVIKWPRERAEDPKPFLDGMTPSEWLMEEDRKNTGKIVWTGPFAILVFADLLVEELKNRNVIK